MCNCEENDESDDTNRKENKENNITVEDLKTRPAFPDKASAALAPKTFLADNYYHPFIIVSKFLTLWEALKIYLALILIFLVKFGAVHEEHSILH